MYSHLNCIIDYLADAVKLFFHFTVADSHDMKTVVFQSFRSSQIECPSLMCVMACTINFYDKTCLVAVEVYDEIINDSLLIDLYRILLQIVIPQMPLLRSHRSS